MSEIRTIPNLDRLTVKRGEGVVKNSPFTGRVVGVVLRVIDEPMAGWHIEWRVTSRTNRHYPHGTILRHPCGISGLRKR